MGSAQIVCQQSDDPFHEVVTHPRCCSVKLTMPPLCTKAFETRNDALARRMPRKGRLIGNVYLRTTRFSSVTSTRRERRVLEFRCNLRHTNVPGAKLGHRREIVVQAGASELYPSGTLRRRHCRFLNQRQCAGYSQTSTAEHFCVAPVLD